MEFTIPLIPAKTTMDNKRQITYPAATEASASCWLAL